MPSYSFTLHQDLRSGEVSSESSSKSTPVVPPDDSGSETPQNYRSMTWDDLAYPQKQR